MVRMSKAKIVAAFILPLVLVAIPVSILALGIGRPSETIFQLKDYSRGGVSLKDATLVFEGRLALLEGKVGGLSKGGDTMTIGLKLKSSEGSREVVLEVPTKNLGSYLSLCFDAEEEVSSCTLEYVDVSAGDESEFPDDTQGSRDRDQDQLPDGTQPDGDGDENGQDSTQTLPGHEDIPLPSGAVLMSREDSEEMGGELFEYQVELSVEEVSAYYDREMEARGWALEAQENVEGVVLRSYLKDSKMLVLEAGPDAGGTLLRLAVAEY